MPRTTIMPRGKRPPRAAAANSSAINNALLGKRNIGPALAVNLPGPSSAPDRPCPSGGFGVKNMDRFRKRNRDIKIKKVLPQSKVVQVKKKWSCRKNDDGVLKNVFSWKKKESLLIKNKH